MEQASERRREVRHAIIEEVFDQKAGKSIGHTADLNAKGMMIVGNKPFSIGDEIWISIDIPNGNDKKTRTSLNAQCRWCEPHPGTPFYNTGFRFKYTTKFDIQFIQTLFMGLSEQY